MTRVVEAEILDHLPINSAEAKRSRRDLRRLNLLMGNVGYLFLNLRKHRFGRLIDIGGGDGWAALSVTKELFNRAGLREVVVVDRQPATQPELAQKFETYGVTLNVESANVFNWLAIPRERAGTAIMANLFLHHFDESDLRNLLGLAATQCELFVACEPRRAAWPQLAASLVGLIGCNRVTRHDAVVSVRAGFRDQELSALWPDRAKWQMEERSAGLFSHLFVARRR